MRGNTSLLEVRDKLGSIIPFVSPQRQASGRSVGMAVHHVQRVPPLGVAISLGQVALDNRTVPGLHQGMAHEPQHRANAPGFLGEPGIRIRDRDMRRAEALLALEVNLSVALTVIGARQQFGHGLGLFGMGVGGGIIFGVEPEPSSSGGMAFDFG